MGRCGGDWRRLQDHEVLKMSLKDLVLSNYKPGGAAFPASSILIEPPHLRQDKSRLGDIYALGRGVHRMDSVMDIVIASALTKSCSLPYSQSSDFMLRQAENKKFNNDLRSTEPIQESATRRLIPLASNHFGLRGPHFQVVLQEFATLLVAKPGGCPLLKGPFALTHTAAINHILHAWGGTLTWTLQREHAAQLVKGMLSFWDSMSFLGGTSWGGGGQCDRDG
jgi:hypothetical protein